MKREPPRLAMATRALRAALGRSESTTLVVQGGSMRPWLRPGARVRLRRLAAGEPRPGQIVAIDRGSRVVVHRVLEATAGSVRARGDAAVDCDDPVSSEAIIGRVDAVEAGCGIWCRLPELPAVAAAVRVAFHAARLVRLPTRRRRRAP